MTYLFKSRTDATNFVIELMDDGIEFMVKPEGMFKDDKVIVLGLPSRNLKNIIQINLDLGIMIKENEDV